MDIGTRLKKARAGKASQQQIADFGIIAKIVLFQRNSFCV